MSITIYHNPDCGTSRNTLALIRNSGAEPTIIYYLETPPSGDELRQLRLPGTKRACRGAGRLTGAG